MNQKRKPLQDKTKGIQGNTMNKKKVVKRNDAYNLGGLETREEEMVNEDKQQQKQYERQQYEKNRNKNHQIRDMNEDSDFDEDQDYNIDDVEKDQVKTHDRLSEVVIGLIMKNKINSKNAFDVPLPDVQKLSNFIGDETEQAWKIFSSTLDAGSKVYGFRVDGFHSEAYKILGGLNRADVDDKDKDKKQEQNQKKGIDQEAEELLLQNTNQKDYRGISTLEKNVNNLNNQKYEQEFEIDPLFQKTSAKFDEGGAHGLLLNNLAIDNDVQLMLDSDMKNNELLAQKQNKHTSCYTSLLDLKVNKKDVQQIFDLNICPELSAFKEDIEKNSKEIFNVSKIRQMQESHISNMAVINNEEENNNMFEDMQMANELDNILEEQNPSQFQEIIEVEEDNMQIENENEDHESNSNFSFHNDDNNDFANNDMDENTNQDQNGIKQSASKSNFDILKKSNMIGIGTGIVEDNINWMEPEGWQLNKNKPKKQVVKAEKDQEKKKVNENKIDFNLDEEEDIREVMGISKKKIKLKNDTSIAHLHLLAFDQHIDSKRFTEVSLRDKSLIFQQPQNNYDDNADYDFDAHEEADADIDNQAEFNFNEKTKPSIAKDNKAETKKSAVPIKELKVKVWDFVKDILPSKQKIFEEVEVTKKKMKKNPQMDLEYDPKEGFEFVKIYEALPDILGPQNAKKVTVQTCFLTLLHLANERDLKFCEQPESGDFTIFQEKVQ